MPFAACRGPTARQCLKSIRHVDVFSEDLGTKLTILDSAQSPSKDMKLRKGLSPSVQDIVALSTHRAPGSRPTAVSNPSPDGPERQALWAGDSTAVPKGTALIAHSYDEEQRENRENHKRH